MLAEVIAPLIAAEALVAGYGNKRVVDGVSLQVGANECVALIGHNGAGKSTLLRAVFGLLPSWAGTLCLDGKRIDGHSPRHMLRAGVSYVPQGNRVFSTLTVQESLRVACVSLKDGRERRDDIDRVLTLFPLLRERLRQRAGSLSGGEKQMLALASALVLSPRLLLLDEPTLGLAPGLIDSVFRMIEALRDDGQVAALVVDQRVRQVLACADRVYVLRQGRVAFSGDAEVLRNDANLLHKLYMGAPD